jgi:fumarate reductase subunit C
LSQIAESTTPVYRRSMPAGWWLRHRNYTLYMIREFTPVFMVAWLVWFLYDVYRLNTGQYTGHSGDVAFIVFSAVCLFFTLWHAITFLSLSGLILRIPFGDGYASPMVVRALAFGGLIFVTLVGGAILVWLGTFNL